MAGGLVADLTHATVRRAGRVVGVCGHASMLTVYALTDVVLC